MSRGGEASSAVNGGAGGGEILLFGVRVKVDPMRKSVSMNNLSQYEQPNYNSNESSNAAADIAAAGYASADEAVNRHSSGGRERKRGVPWTEEEHKLFLLGLQKVGKGDWRGISRNFVKTRTPTQVASHAQKYFLRRNNLNRRRRRSSLFDITTDSVTAIPMEQDVRHGSPQPVLPPQSLLPPETSNISGFPVTPFPMTVGPVLSPLKIENPIESLSQGQGHQVSTMLVHPIPVLPMPNASRMTDLNLNQKSTAEAFPLSLKLSLSSDQNYQSEWRNSAFQVMPGFNNGDNIISVA
ncbi:unnamed protein product [Ilex paraguariensis]|uniref:Transcription factor MYB1R1 n=1 Tax=Ilex paraguariensis TaxID=185542 RepID=A0ABC8UUJ7_9AQUA